MLLHLDTLSSIRANQSLLFFLNAAYFQYLMNCIGSVMVSVLASNVVDHGFKPRAGKTKDYETGICCFSIKNAALKANQNELDFNNE
jgi:hypothetical protein